LTLPVATFNNIIFRAPSNIAARIALPESVLVIKRHTSDNFLFEEAKQVTETCHTGFTTTDLLWEGDQAVGVKGQMNGKIHEFRANAIFGADGFNSIVARKANLYRHTSRHSLVAIRCYYENVEDIAYIQSQSEPGHILLIDPDKASAEVAAQRAVAAVAAGSRMVFVGGSSNTKQSNVNATVVAIKNALKLNETPNQPDIPMVLFP